MNLILTAHFQISLKFIGLIYFRGNKYTVLLNSARSKVFSFI